MTREGYDTGHLIGLLRRFKQRHPGLEVVLEPGSAFTWRTGDLIASVVDVVENSGIKTAIVDVSFACHMPDCLEMPYKPTITEALPEVVPGGENNYRMGGNSCLSGDFVGDWSFAAPLRPGDRLTFEDMNHYTTVKTNMFNDAALDCCMFTATAVWKCCVNTLMPITNPEWTDCGIWNRLPRPKGNAWLRCRRRIL